MEDFDQSLLDTDAVLQPFLQAAHESSTNAATVRALVLKVLSEADVFAGYDEIKAVVESTLQKMGPEGDKLSRTLDLFSYGTYPDYRHAAPDTFMALTENQVWKLRQLSVITLVQQACQQKSSRIPYETIQQALDLPDLRATEQLLVSCLYAHVISGQLCQKSRSLLLAGRGGRVGLPCRPRDVPLSQVSVMLDTIRAFQQRLLETSQSLANDAKQVHYHVQAHRSFVHAAVERKKKVEALHASGGAGGGSSSSLTGQVRAASLGDVGAGGGDAMDVGGGGGNAGSRGSARRQKRSRGGLTAGIADASFGRYQL